MSGGNKKQHKQLLVFGVITFCLGIGAFIGLAVTGLLLSAWLVIPVVLFLLTALTGLIGIRLLYKQTPSSVPDNKQVTSENITEKPKPSISPQQQIFANAPKEPSLQAVDTTKKPNCPYHTSYTREALSFPHPPITQELALSSNEEEKVAWAMKDCESILLNCGMGTNHFFLQDNAAHTDKSYKISITFWFTSIVNTLSYFFPQNANEILNEPAKLNEAFLDIKNKGEEKITEKYRPRKNDQYESGYTGGTILYDGHTSNRAEIYIHQKAIDWRIQQEWQKEQFKARILNLFSKATSLHADDITFIMQPEIKYCVEKNGKRYYEFYSMTTQSLDKQECSNYLTWLKDMLNTHIFGKNVIQLCTEHDTEKPRVTLKLKVFCDDFAEVLRLEEKAKNQPTHLLFNN